MAVVKMNKITVLGLSKERKQLLDALMRLGVVEIKQDVPTDDIRDNAFNINVQNDLAKIDAVLADLERALGILDSYVPKKMPLFSTRRIVSETEYHDVMKNSADIVDGAGRINQLEDEVARIKSEINRLANLSDSLEPWLALEIPLNDASTKYTFTITGTLSSTINLDVVDEELASVCPESVMLRATSDRERHYIAVIAHKSIENEVMALLRNYGFNKFTFKEIDGTAKEAKEILDMRISSLGNEREKKLAAIKDLAEKRDQLEIVCDGYRMERTRLEAKSRLISTRSVFMLKGWLPAEHSQKLKDYLDKNFYCAIEIEEPGEDEDFPVLLQNGPVADSITPVVSMYGVPSCREIDPSAITLPFFAFLFGLMFGDGGYGIIICLVTGFILKKYKLEESTKQFIKLIFICGLATILAGALFGSWFGIPALAKTALWIVPTQQPELMMSYSILIGIVHMYTGLIVSALNLIRRGQIVDAICDVFFKLIMFTGFIMSLLPFAPGVTISSSSGIVKTGYYVFAIGVALVLLTAGRNSKNIFGKIFGGLPKLYDVIGFFSDCLSYTRILALGLASAIIADIVNSLASSFGGFIVVKYLVMTLVLVIGHVLNFALNALGAYVHSCRLQYLEFYGKFLEGGGEAFKPLQASTKYIVVKSQVNELLNSGTGIAQ